MLPVFNGAYVESAAEGQPKVLFEANDRKGTCNLSPYIAEDDMSIYRESISQGPFAIDPTDKFAVS